PQVPLRYGPADKWWDPPGNIAFLGKGPLVAIGGVVDRIRIIDITTGRLVRTISIDGFDFHDGGVVSPDGKLIAADSYPDRGIKILDVESGQVIQSIDKPPNAIDKPPSASYLYVSRFDNSGRFLFVGQFENTSVRVWDTTSKTFVRTLDFGKAAFSLSANG